jgi:hypothetical protein
VADLDALYVNFISGFELDLPTAQLLRRGFPAFMYADFHSLFLGKLPDGTRVLQPLADPAAWFACFDVVQLNDEELSQVGPDPLAVAALALGAGCRALCVTLGSQGAVVLTGSPVRSIRFQGFGRWRSRRSDGWRRAHAARARCFGRAPRTPRRRRSPRATERRGALPARPSADAAADDRLVRSRSRRPRLDQFP